MKQRLLAVWIVLCVTLFGLPAFAQSGREEFEKANRFFEAGEYDAALPLYRQAYRLSNRRPSTIRALAQCERALKLYPEAIEHFREYLASQPADAAQIQETLKLVEDLQSQRPPDPAAEIPDQTAVPPLSAEDPGSPGGIKATTGNWSDGGAAPGDPTALVAPAPKAEESSFLESPLFWGITGAAVLGVVLVIVVASGERDPSGGSAGIVLYR